MEPTVRRIRKRWRLRKGFGNVGGKVWSGSGGGEGRGRKKQWRRRWEKWRLRWRRKSE